MQIILILLVIGISIWIIKGIIGLFKGLLKIALVIAGIALYAYFFSITMPLTVIAISIFIIKFIYGKLKIHRELKRRQKINRTWIKEHNECYAIQDVDATFRDLMKSIYVIDENSSEYKFNDPNLPYGRINAFLSYFNKNIDMVEPYYYSCIPSKNNSELREYGIVIARDGIYVSRENSEAQKAMNEFLPFAGLKSIEIKENKILAISISKENYDDCIQTLSLPKMCVGIKAISMICQGVINRGISASYYCNNIVDLDDDVSLSKYGAKISQKLQSINKPVEKVAMESAFQNNKKIYNELKGYMGGSQGGGYAAEYANSTFDKLSGHITENTAQKLDAKNHQVKNGADRTVDGRQIQTKYYKTARESISAAFENGEARYIDNKGKMMQIEVPRDQYAEALEEMQKRIDNGEVPGYEAGEGPWHYVRKSCVTYRQSNNVALAGTIEGLTVDMGQGVINSLNPAGISATIVFAMSILNGESLEDAAYKSMNTAVNVLGKNTFVYILTMQFSRKEIAIPNTTKYLKQGTPQGNESISNPVFAMSEKLAEEIRNSDFAKTQIGRSLQINNVNGRALIQNSFIALYYFGPDVYKALTGKISAAQLTKNSVVAMSTLAVGGALMPISVVGGIIGGTIAHFAAQCIMDEFIEDDQVKMFRILKEEFIDAVSIAGLTKEEVDEVLNDTIAHPELEQILQNMFRSGEPRRYARVAIMDEAIVIVMRKRRRITMQEYKTAIERYLAKIA